MVANSFDDALTQLCNNESIEEVFVIGGESIYREALKSELCKRVLLTCVQGDFDCDTFMPPIPAQKFDFVHESAEHDDNGIRYTFQRFDNRLFFSRKASSGSEAGTEATPDEGNFEEQAYLDAVRDIIDNGVERRDRTGVGTKAKFGVQMRFSLRDEVFPLLTTKRVINDNACGRSFEIFHMSCRVVWCGLLLFDMRRCFGEVLPRSCCGLSRAARMRTNSRRRRSISGTATLPATSWTSTY